MQLHGSTAILTGASRGIGVYLARALARRNVHLALVARSESDLETTAKEISAFGTRCITISADVSRREDLANVVERTRRELGPISLLVNNAGIERYTHYEDAELDEIESILRTNLLGAQWLTRLVLPEMVRERRGHIVNIASVAGKTGVPFNATYSASKHALVGFSLSLRQEMARHGIGVSVVCPGFVRDAGMFSDWSKGAKPPPLTKTVSPEKVADETVSAIEKDRAETIVSSPVLRAVGVLQALSPDLVAWLGRKSGTYRFLEEKAIPAWEKD